MSISNNPVTNSHQKTNRSDHRTLLLKEEYRQVVEAIPHAILIVNLQGKVESANMAASLLLDYTPLELLHMPLEHLIPDCASELQDLLDEGFSETPSSVCLINSNDFKIVRKNRSTRYIELSIALIEAVEGRFLMLSIVDVHEHRLTEQELSRSNIELDQFAYVASHDLKAPLRGVDNLLTWICEDIDDKDLVADHIKMMRSRIHGMHTLLNDLLEYSRVGRIESSIFYADINQLAQDIFQQSSPPDGFQLKLTEPIAPFKALATPLTQVLRNLISNAIKHHDKKEGVIKVSACDQGQFVEIAVEDNGPGIEEQYQERIFGMFEKLKSKDEVEGSGMGLAMVKKITESLGGTIRVTSTVGEGSTFYLQWLKQDIVNTSQ